MNDWNWDSTWPAPALTRNVRFGVPVSMRSIVSPAASTACPPGASMRPSLRTDDPSSRHRSKDAPPNAIVRQRPTRKALPMYLNEVQVQLMRERMAEIDREARLAWLKPDRFAPRPERFGLIRRGSWL